METIAPPSFSARQIGAALAIGSIALLMLGLQPILLGELVTRHVITMEGVGIVAMGEIVTLGLGVVLGDALLPLSRYRLIAVLAAVVVAVLDAATCYGAGDGQLVGVRAATGLAEGVLVWVTTSVIVRSHKPDRLAAIFMVVQTVSQTAMAALLATWVVPRAGWQGGFQALVVASVLTAVLVYWLPSRLAPLAASASAKLGWSAATKLPLAIAFMQMAALGSMWAYLEPLGLRVGFDAQGAQAVTSQVLFAQVVGGISAVWLVRHLNVVPSLGIGAAVLAAIAGAIHLLPPGATIAFASLCAVFGFAWLSVMPLHVSLAFRADAQGRVAMLIPAAQLLGSAFGPLVASFIVEGEDAGAVPVVSLAFALVSFGLLIAASRSSASAPAFGPR